MISSASAYLFLKADNVLLSNGKGLPRHGKPNAECTVVPLTLILQLQYVLDSTPAVFQDSQYGLAATLLLTDR